MMMVRLGYLSVKRKSNQLNRMKNNVQNDIKKIHEIHGIHVTHEIIVAVQHRKNLFLAVNLLTITKKILIH